MLYILVHIFAVTVAIRMHPKPKAYSAKEEEEDINERELWVPNKATATPSRAAKFN
jgi:hypothetical protein